MIVIPMLLLSSCTKSYFSRAELGFDSFPKNPVSPERAVKLAEPYLDNTFKVKTDDSVLMALAKPKIWVTLKGKYYYIVKDSTNEINIDYYLYKAVKVNKNTGEVIPPK